MNSLAGSSITERLRQEILLARERVYHFGNTTPLERMDFPEQNLEVWVKREDLSPIKAYKWRGAANRMKALTELERARGVVTASAGNHAQGVALAARKLGILSRIYMPLSTPRVKQDAVKKLGQEYVSVHLSGESYDEAVAAAREDEIQTKSTYVHAYDDLQVIAGQGTLADEIVLSGEGPFDAAYVQIGGGGMAAGVATWFKTYWPNMPVYGVESEDQASMQASLDAAEAVELPHVGLFCDGTAVRKPGALPFEICKQVLDGVVTVSNKEVTSAIRHFWEGLRCISEPSGALSLAAALKEEKTQKKRRVLVILCGANVDFKQIGRIARSAGSDQRQSKTLRIEIPEKSGTMLQLLETCLQDVDIVDFQHGITSPDRAFPVFTLSSHKISDLNTLAPRLAEAGFAFEDITGAADAAFRAIPLNTTLLNHPLFLRLDFYERRGALRDFLAQRLQGNGTIIYFNYQHSGERIGRALVGIDFPSTFEREAFLLALPKTGDGYRLCEPLDANAHSRLASFTKPVQ